MTVVMEQHKLLEAFLFLCVFLFELAVRWLRGAEKDTIKDGVPDCCFP